MLNSCVLLQLAAGVRRLQAVQGRARAPRLVAGHRARAARHPGQQRRAVATSTRTSTRPTSTGWPREAGVTHEDIYAEKADPTDLKRLASPEEVARATLFLASDLASAVTGQMLDVDCGEFHELTERQHDDPRAADVGSYDDIVAAAVRTTGLTTSAAPPTRRGCGSWSRTSPRPRPG